MERVAEKCYVRTWRRPVWHFSETVFVSRLGLVREEEQGVGGELGTCTESPNILRLLAQ